MEKNRYYKSYICDEYIALIMFLWGGIQAFTYILSNKQFELVIVEEILFVISLLFRERQIFAFNCILKKGKIIYADYDERGSYYSTYKLRGPTRYILHVYCVKEGKRYSGRVDIGAADEGYRKSLIDVLRVHKIPVLVTENDLCYSIFLNDLILEYMYFDKKKKEKEAKKTIYSMMFWRYIIIFFIVYFSPIS